MGRLASGTGLPTFLGASVAFLWAATGWAQAPLPPSADKAPGTSPRASEALPPAPSPPPALPPSAAEPVGGRREKVPLDFVLRSSPWVDFSLTSFHLEDRTGNFLNLGVQVGGYLFERLRVAGRIVTPLADVNDDYSTYNSTQFDGSQSFTRVKARSMSMLYSASVGILITNSRSFAFGPSVEFARTDVAAYGSAVLLALPFEWTTIRHLRVGFELALGHSFGGTLKETCLTATSPVVSCGLRTTDRPSGTAVLAQFNMGWSLGAL